MSEVLTILVIRGQTVGRIFLSILVGMSSSLQDLDFICLIIRTICFSVSGANLLSKGTDVSVIASYWGVPLNSPLICKILFLNKFVKSSASSSFVLCVLFLKKFVKSSASSSFVLCVSHFCDSGLFVRLVTSE